MNTMPESITATWIGEEYGWDKMEEVDWDLLKQNLESALNVFANPDKFPNADFAEIETKIYEIEAFMALHAPS